MNLTSDALPTAIGVGKRVAKNAAWLFIGRLGSQALTMLFSILVARRLGEAGLGEYAFMTSVIFLGNLTTTFGTDMLIIREVSAKRDLSLLSASLVLQLALSLPFIVLVWLLAPAIPNQTPDAINALKLFSLALIPLAFYSVFSSALRGVERMDSYTWLNLFNGIVLIVFGFAFIRPETSALTLATILLASQTLATVVAGTLCGLQIPGLWSAWRVSSQQLRNLVHLSAPIAILGLLGALYQRAAIFLLATLQGAAAAGTFSAALRSIEAAKIGHIAILGALFPVMAQASLGAVDRQAFRVFSSSLLVLLAIAGFFAVVLFFFADPLIPLLFGSEFQSSVSVLKTLAWVLIPMTVSHFLSLLLLAAAREGTIMLALGASTILLAGFILFTLPRFGLQAAAIGMLVAEFLQAGILIIGWRKVRAEGSHAVS